MTDSITVNRVKRKRTAAKTAKAKATTLHSKVVRARGACENCGTNQNLQCAHIVSRRYAATRTREDNAYCLCAKCHMHFTEWPAEFTKFVFETVGETHYNALRWASLNDTPPGWANEVQRLTAVWKRLQDAA